MMQHPKPRIDQSFTGPQMELPGEKLVLKLWETLVEKGIGGFVAPYQAKRVGIANAETRAEEMRIIAQAEVDVKKILDGKVIQETNRFDLPKLTGERQSLDARVEPSLDPNQLLNLSLKHQYESAIRKDINLSNTIIKAETILLGSKDDEPSETINTDWAHRWKDYASEVSTEELQTMWANILATEFKCPGSFALRTLEFLRNISSNEAQLIEKFSPFLANGRIIYHNFELLEKEGITLDDLINMQHLGVFQGIEGKALGYSFGMSESNNYVSSLTSEDNMLFITPLNGHFVERPQIPIINITPIGIEIFRLCTQATNMNYFKQLGISIKNKGFKVALGKHKKIEGNSFEFYLTEEL